MPVPPLRPTSSLRFFLPALLVLLAGTAAAWAVLHRSDEPTSTPHRVFLRVTAGEGLAEAHRQGLELLLQDHLEVLANLPALAWRTGDVTPPTHSLYLDLRAQRSGADLALQLAWSPGAAGPWTPVTVGAAPPAEALARALEALPLGLKVARDGKLRPESPEACWDLVEALGLIDVRSAADRAEAQAKAVAAAAPDNAEAQLALGVHLYSQLQWHPKDRFGDEFRAMAAFQRAKTLVPGHPRATRELAILLADTGRGPESLEGLAEALRQRHGIPRIFEALAYAARYSGLLTVSRRALDTQHMLALGQTRQVGETTLLYQGHPAAFLETCKPRGGPIDTKGYYYQGYVALAQGQREAAMTAFRASTDVPEGWYGFEDLSRAHLLALEGRPAEARQVLAALCRSREGLRIADGEFTFKQGEAWAYLGDAEAAMEQLHRALSQDFCCLAWYESSPFLAPLRSHPRWVNLLQHVRERHALREGKFPPSSFGL